MGSTGIAPFLLRYIRLLATVSVLILVWSLVDHAVLYTLPEHILRSSHASTPSTELPSSKQEKHHEYIHHTEPEAPTLLKESTRWAEVNSTLGFGTILAVSHAKSKRKAGLLWAANITGIDVEIPDQPVWTQEDLDSVQKGKEKGVDKGSALAWLGHLNALRKFLSTSHETALILEDDADWDIALRSSEIPLAAAALRHLFETASNVASSPEQPKKHHHQHHMHHKHPATHRPTLTPSTDPNYWGPTASWELLHLGHSDSEQYDRENGATLARIHSNPHHSYPDPSLPGPERLHPSTKTLLHSLAIPSTSRLWHRSHWPLGSYAYGITRAAAQRLVDYSTGSMGSASAVAFDVVLLELCRDHGWKCWTLEPGLVGEFNTPSEIALANMDGAERDKERPMGLYDTWNMRCAVRQRALWVEEGDESGRRDMIERVKKGDCPR